jgi:hypothetical protein
MKHESEAFREALKAEVRDGKVAACQEQNFRVLASYSLEFYVSDHAPSLGSWRRLVIPTATATPLGNGWLKQHEVSARLARVEPNNRMALSRKCETLRLAIQIAEPPRVKERRGAAPRRKIIEPRYRGRLVTEQIEVAIRSYLEVTEVGASFSQ